MVVVSIMGATTFACLLCFASPALLGRLKVCSVQSGKSAVPQPRDEWWFLRYSHHSLDGFGEGFRGGVEPRRMARRTHQIPDPTSQIRNPKSYIPNPKSQIRNPKSEIQNPKSKIRNPKSEIQNPKSKIQNPKSKIQNPKSEIRNPKSEIRNPKSEIRNPKSEIRNPKSLPSHKNARRGATLGAHPPRHSAGLR